MKAAKCQVFWDRLASFGLITEPHINFQKSQNGINGHKGLENINFTVWGDTLQTPHGNNTSC